MVLSSVVLPAPFGPRTTTVRRRRARSGRRSAAPRSARSRNAGPALPAGPSGRWALGQAGEATRASSSRSASRTLPDRHDALSARRPKSGRRMRPTRPLRAWARKIAAIPTPTGCHSRTAGDVNTAGSQTRTTAASTAPPSEDGPAVTSTATHSNDWKMSNVWALTDSVSVPSSPPATARQEGGEAEHQHPGDDRVDSEALHGQAASRPAPAGRGRAASTRTASTATSPTTTTASTKK